MLRAVDENGDSMAVSPAAAPPPFAATPPVAPVARGGYGQKRFNPSAIAITVALHVALIAGLMTIHYKADETRRDRLTVVDLRSSSPPPPPSPSPSPPPPSPEQKSSTPQSPIVAPPRMVQLALPTNPVVTMPKPAPEEPAGKQAVNTPSEVPAPPSPPAPPGTVTSSDLGTRMISGAPPRYPIECRRKREQGTVVLALILDLEGRVESISIAHSSGSERLDAAARNAVRNWRWAPTMRDGHAVKVKGVVEIPFVLQG